jgi:hypothetical protein
MPFQSDTRSGTFITQLNVNVIREELEIMLEKQYTEDIDEGSKFWYYVSELEFKYNCYLNSNPTNPIPFWDWFLDNYNNIYAYEEIEEYFVDEDENKDEDEDEDEEIEVKEVEVKGKKYFYNNEKKQLYDIETHEEVYVSLKEWNERINEIF